MRREFTTIFPAAMVPLYTKEPKGPSFPGRYMPNIATNKSTVYGYSDMDDKIYE